MRWVNPLVLVLCVASLLCMMHAFAGFARTLYIHLQPTFFMAGSDDCEMIAADYAPRYRLGDSAKRLWVRIAVQVGVAIMFLACYQGLLVFAKATANPWLLWTLVSDNTATNVHNTVNAVAFLTGMFYYGFWRHPWIWEKHPRRTQA